MSLSDKVRIHDFAKQYGMPGKDLAAKLRDFGFSKARSHMSALDPFDLVTAQGVLEANGIMPVGEGVASPEVPSGGLRLFKRMKKSSAEGEEAAVTELEPEPEAPVADEADERTAPAAVRTMPRPGGAGPLPTGTHAGSSGATLPTRPSSPMTPAAGSPTAAASAGSTAAASRSTSTGAAEAATGTAEAAASAAVAAAASPSNVAEAPPVATAPTADAPVAPERAQGAAREATPASSAAAGVAPRSGESAGQAPATATGTAPSNPFGDPEVRAMPAPRATGGQGVTTTAPAARGGAAPSASGSASPTQETTPAAHVEAASAESSSASSSPVLVPPPRIGLPRPVEPRSSAQANDPPRRGNVVGFVDPATFQQQPQKKKASSRRIQSRDETTPDVRPTLGGGTRRAGGPASPQPAATGPRGKLTATELREREQNRFLRHNRTSQTGHTQGRRAGGGRRTESANESPYAGGSVAIAEPITIGKLADALALKAALVVQTAWSTKLGMFTMNQTLDAETAVLIAAEFEVDLEIKEDISVEQAHLDEVRSKRSELEEEELVPRSPTVAFLGHVDHGKTTLIDKIRSTRVAAGESGGITQHVGAYRVTTSKGHEVTIIDTPGHEAFTSMRARGARAVDIVVLVVAGDDGVKPSTVEAINHARAAKSPIVVAINKKDKPDFNANAVISQLGGHDLMPPEYGGSTAMFHTSGITGEGIDELLEHIFLMGEIELGLKAHPKGPASGVVLEAEIQQGRGIVAHLLVQDGTLSKGDVILAGEGYGKVRQILNDRGGVILEAGPSIPVAVDGLDALPGVGDAFYVVDSLAKAKQIATERGRTNRAKLLAEARDPRKQAAALLEREAGTEAKILNLILRTDVQGSAEVLKSEIAKLGHDEVELKVIHSGVGPVTESDVDLATPSLALILAFKVGVNGKARQNAERAGVTIKRYDVIYELLDDLRLLMEGALRPEFEEVITGHVEIRTIFKSSRIGLIAGCMVQDGSVKRNSLVRLMRDGKTVYTGSLASLRREKDDAREVREGFECGIVLKDYRDIQVGDIIECYEMKAVKRTL
jgi:translation initiation factor IF-2